MARKGWPSQKLTPLEVARIRRAAATPCTCGRRPTLKQLAAEHNVSPVAIHKIVRGETWQDVEPERVASFEPLDPAAAIRPLL